MPNKDICNVDYLRRNFKPKEAVSVVKLPLKPVKLPGDDYIAGDGLFPGRVIAGYHAPYYEYDADSWAKYVLKRTEAFEAGTSCVSYTGEFCSLEDLMLEGNFGGTVLTCDVTILAINSGDTGGRYWFGYSFRGGPADPTDFVHADPESGVKGSRAYR